MKVKFFLFFFFLNLHLISWGSDNEKLIKKWNDPHKIDTLTSDGAWCWFNDPRAIYYKGEKEQTYFSWINSVGDIVIAAYNHETGEYIEHVLYEKLEVDDHDNPAILFRKDGRLVVYFSKHTTAPAHRFISTNPEDITSWGEDYRFGENVTYPYPFQVGDSIYVFYRGLNWHPSLIISEDDGETMGSPMQFITGGGSRPYTRFFQDPTGAIHIAVTTGHPRNEPNNKIYYAKFKDGKFYKADGTFIKEYTGSSTALDLDRGEAEVVYDARNGKGWIWDIAVDENNNPVMVYASFPSDTDHRYHYARWNGGSWFNNEITSAGKWFPQTPAGRSEPEPNYSGGIILDSDEPSVVYLSKQVDGVFEIFKYTTNDRGATWSSGAITSNTPSDIVNVRPIVPRNHKKGLFDVIWMRGRYVHYTNYHTALVFHMDSTVNVLDSIVIKTNEIELLEGASQPIEVTYFPFITSNKTLTWQSSDKSIAVVESGKVVGLQKGTAILTATTINGKTAQTKVTVVEPVYISNALFDFGTSESTLAEGAERMTGARMLENSFGWDKGVLARDRGASASEELRDFNYSSAPATFKVYVKPGIYHITAKQGDQSFPHDNMSIYVNGEKKVSLISTTEGTFHTSEFDVETNKNFLEFMFVDESGPDENWVINSMKIDRIGNVPEEPKNPEEPENPEEPQNPEDPDTEPEVTGFKEENDEDISQLTEGNIAVFDLQGRLMVKEKLSGRTFVQALGNKIPGNKIYVIVLEAKGITRSLKYCNCK